MVVIGAVISRDEKKALTESSYVRRVGRADFRENENSKKACHIEHNQIVKAKS